MHERVKVRHRLVYNSPVWGTLIAVAVLAVTVAGLNQFGTPFFVEPLFNGLMMTLAVGVSVTAARRRERKATEK